MTTQLTTAFATFGTTMPKTGITKFKAKVGETRIKVLSVSEQDFLFVRTHYLPNVGTFHCFNGSCCLAASNAETEGGNTSERAILPIAIYKPLLTGGVTVDYAYIALPQTKYDSLVSLHNNVGDVTKYDLLINCTDEGFQKYEFTPLANQAPLIDSIPGEAERVNTFLANYRMNIRKTTGKEFNEQTFQAALTNVATKTANGLGAKFVPNAAASQVFSQPQNVPLPTPAVQPVAQIAEQPKEEEPKTEPVIEAVATPIVEQPVETVKAEEPKAEVQSTPAETSDEGEIDWAAYIK